MINTAINYTPRHRALLAAVLVIACGVQSVTTHAQPVDPTTDAFPVFDFNDTSKSFVVRLRFINRFNVELDSVQVTTDMPAGKAGDPRLLMVRVEDLGGSMLDEFGAWHPQWAFRESSAGGPEQRILLSNRVGRITAAYHPEAARMLVRDVAAGDLLVATVDLLPASHDFCRNNPGEPDCVGVPNRAPICNAGGPYTAQCTGASTSVALNGSLSSDPDLDPITLEWQGAFTGGSPVFGTNPTVGFSGVGNKTIDLQVSDGATASTCGTTATIIDTLDPVVSAPPISLTRCSPAPTNVVLGATVTDACGTGGPPALTGRLMSAAGKPLPAPITISGGQVILPIGAATVEWTATDGNGNVSTPLIQNVSVSFSETVATCCAPGATVVQGTASSDNIFRPFSNNYCVFGNGGWDDVLTGGGVDFIAGGTGSDALESGSGTGDILSGGDSADWIDPSIGTGTTIYGGAGNDIIDQTQAGTIYGNAGDDEIESDFGSHTIYPGPGRDDVDAGGGDDTIVIRNVCELAQFEVLDGGLGNDTLITPVGVSELIAQGVILLGIQNVVIDTTQQHLSECF